MFSLITMPVSAVSSSKDSKFDIVKAKKELVKKYKDKRIILTDEEKKARSEKISVELLELIAMGVDINEIDKKMLLHGLVRLEVPQDLPITSLSASTDITLNSPSVYYDYIADEWTISAGGHWIDDDAWKSDASTLYQLLCPATQNIGGIDSIGISLHDTSGTYNASMVDCQGYYSDGAGDYTLIQYPDNNNYSQGVTFSYQDVINDPTPGSTMEDWKYKGRNFSALATYSGEFVNYSGNANTFYAHTWSSTTVSSVTLGTSGVTIVFSSTDNRFAAYSPDTSF